MCHSMITRLLGTHSSEKKKNTTEILCQYSSNTSFWSPSQSHLILLPWYAVVSSHYMPGPLHFLLIWARISLARVCSLILDTHFLSYYVSMAHWAGQCFLSRCFASLQFSALKVIIGSTHRLHTFCFMWQPTLYSECLPNGTQPTVILNSMASSWFRLALTICRRYIHFLLVFHYLGGHLQIIVMPSIHTKSDDTEWMTHSVVI